MEEVFGGMGSGLVGVRIKGMLTDKLSAISRNELTLEGIVLP